ncbi:MAG: hypothetical protein K2Q33_00750 [Gammaproteobacteria bacterium]|nr:hypothetical protein [Gammaproteobacteria bacterium]
MQIHLDDANPAYRIQGYENNQVTINHTIYNHNLIVSSQKIWPDCYVAHDSHSTEEALLMPFIALKPQIFLFGTGENQQFLSPWLQSLFYNHSIGVEAMSTIAACRTYNLLLAEGRYVMASLVV